MPSITLDVHKICIQGAEDLYDHTAAEGWNWSTIAAAEDRFVHKPTSIAFTTRE
ncbi:hypothetical protein [Arthrobacter sp. A5]|uniref:hypothetical protein n=1 Tax=Arthrobacter sp. A5 TaxID=576926 RepID=UPI003DA92744